MRPWPRPLVFLFLALGGVVTAPTTTLSQPVALNARLALYGDNTEFFTPYREGATLLGGQFWSRLVVEPSPKFLFHAGVFGDVRWGSTEFLDTVKPILSFRYHTATSLGVLGTLETERRHGLLEPLAVTTLDITRPVEYGLQWRERRHRWDAEVFVNWQALNTEDQREAFDYGWVVRVKPVPQVAIVHQLHGLHRGGQLHSAEAAVTNNAASGLGVEAREQIARLGLGSIALYQLWSRGNIDPEPPPGRPSTGRGTYLRAGLSPATGVELFAIQWWGRDFLALEGDNNYGSVGLADSAYRSRRTYFELGVLRRARFEGGVELDAEFRLHRFDGGLRSDALFNSSWEYSYRLVARAPFEVRLR